MRRPEVREPDMFESVFAYDRSGLFHDFLLGRAPGRPK